MERVYFSTAYFPPVSWMALVLHYQRAIIETQETYPKQTFRNRCIIATSAGVLNLSVPVIRVNGNHTITNDILIDNSRNWQLLHWRSIITAYNKSPYFLFYRDQFEKVFHKEYEKLIDLNAEILVLLTKILNVKILDLVYSADFTFNPEGIDLRNSFNPKKQPFQIISGTLPRYIQVFEEKYGFIPDLSILDLIFNLGPDALSYLSDIAVRDQV